MSNVGQATTELRDTLRRTADDQAAQIAQLRSQADELERQISGLEAKHAETLALIEHHSHFKIETGAP